MASVSWEPLRQKRKAAGIAQPPEQQGERDEPLLAVYYFVSVLAVLQDDRSEGDRGGRRLFRSDPPTMRRSLSGPSNTDPLIIRNCQRKIHQLFDLCSFVAIRCLCPVSSREAGDCGGVYVPVSGRKLLFA